MALPGELKGFGVIYCECGERMPLEILSSPAGYYLGHLCPRCGSCSRETDYYSSYAYAEVELERAKAGEKPLAARDTDFHPAPFEIYTLDNLPFPAGFEHRIVYSKD